jgi:hypothetical protein
LIIAICLLSGAFVGRGRAEPPSRIEVDSDIILEMVGALEHRAELHTGEPRDPFIRLSLIFKNSSQDHKTLKALNYDIPNER